MDDDMTALDKTAARHILSSSRQDDCRTCDGTGRLGRAACPDCQGAGRRPPDGAGVGGGSVLQSLA